MRQHDLIMKTTRGRSSWTLVKGGTTEKVTASLRCSVNSMIAAMNLVLAGIGIDQLPRFVAEPYVAEGRMSCVLRGWAGVPAPVHAVYASTRCMDPKVLSFVDFSLKEFTRSGTKR